MKKIASVFSVAFLVACGGGAPQIATKGVSNEQDATRAMGAVNTAIAASITGGAGRQVSGSADVSVTCKAGGSAKGKVTVNSSGEGNATGKYELSFDGCTNGTDKLTGSVTWSFAVTSQNNMAKIVVEIDGAVAYEGATYAGTFEFDSLKLVYEATASGGSVTVTGGYKIGGVSYTVDQATATSIFGG